MTDEATVDVLLAAAGLDPSPEERTAFVTSYALIKTMTDMLWQVDEARYESPCQVFEPEPRFVDWAGDETAAVPA